MIVKINGVEGQKITHGHIDYRELLVKYIASVYESEGLTFARRLAGFTDEEKKELIGIAENIEVLQDDQGR